jgi:membrane protease YdiL (CAAX protease family)
MASESTPPVKAAARPPRIGVRVGIFAFIQILTLMAAGQILMPWAGPLVTGAASTFFAAVLANAITLRIYERGQLADIGLGSHPGWSRNLLIGAALGIGSGVFVAGVPLLAGMARLVPAPEQPRNWASFVFVSIVLLFGAAGEEMLFRGYGFQLLMRRWGPFATILPVSVLFAWAHSGNPDVTPLALVNTFLWGVMFGICFLRSGDLWLPIGMHVGWNWTLPLFGVNVSGFTMSVTGYVMEWSAGTLWSGGGYGLEGSLLTLLVLPLTGYALWRAPVLARQPFLFRGSVGEEES